MRITANCDRDFNGIFIPSYIWFDERLGFEEMFLLCEIDSVEDTDLGCTYGNGYFSDFLGIEYGKIDGYIKNLEKLGYVVVRYIEGKRYIKSRMSSYTYKKVSGGNENG